ncbi:hypothetical protein [Hyphomicrobium sp. CS1BSMeth3]|uniref:hypothetical protein n=1 Tax=Hyphomicrobium sp. CS1BSMeth3 TaxID=1892844 RepID=UPI0009310F38|nr:hypothetical protein [Hyphomicrobium sp. CS1BSMeth3]
MWPSPEEAQQAKAQRPELASLSDDDAAAVLFVTRATPQQIDNILRQQQQQPASPDAKPYSLWEDVTSMPGAVWRGAVKGFVLEPYDFAREVIGGGETGAHHGEWRKDFENYYKSMPQGSRIVGAFAQFGASYIGLGKLARAAGILRGATTAAGAVGQAAARGAVTDMFAFDGKEARLSNLLREHAGFNDAVTAYLAHAPGDTEAEGRFKNMLEGLGIGVSIDVGLRVVKSLRAAQQGRHADADAELAEAEKAFAAVNKGGGLAPDVQRALAPESPAGRDLQQALATVGDARPQQIPGENLTRGVMAFDTQRPAWPPLPRATQVAPETTPQSFHEASAAVRSADAAQQSIQTGLDRTGLSPRASQLDEAAPQQVPGANATRGVMAFDRQRPGWPPPPQPRTATSAAELAEAPRAGPLSFQEASAAARQTDEAAERSADSVTTALERARQLPAVRDELSRQSVQTALHRFERMKQGPNGITRPMGEWWSQITGKPKATEADVQQSVETALRRFQRLNTPATISDEGTKLTIKPQPAAPSPATSPPVVMRQLGGANPRASSEAQSLAARLRPSNDPLPGQLPGEAPQAHARHAPAIKGIEWEADRVAEEAFLREGTGTVVDRIRALGYDVRVGRDTGFDGEGFQHTRHRIVGVMRERTEAYAQRFGMSVDDAKRNILEHEEIHVLREGGKLGSRQWEALLAAGKEMRIEWGGREAVARDGSPIVSIDDLVRKTGAYEDWYRSQGMTPAEVKEALDQEVVAFMVGNRVAGELPNTPLFREAAEVIGAIRDSSIAAQHIGAGSPSAHRVQTALDRQPPATSSLNDGTLPEWKPRPINEDTPLRPMSDPSHPSTTRLVPSDKALVDGVVDDIIRITRRTDLDAIGHDVPTPSRFDSLTHEGHIRAVIEATEARLLKELPDSFANRGRVSYGEAYKLAQSFARQLGQEPGEILNRITRESDRLENVHARLLAMRQYTSGLAEELHTLARQLDPENARPEFGTYGSKEAAEQALRDKVAHYVMVQDMVGGMTSEVGRALNAMRRSRTPNQQIDFASTAADAPLDMLLKRIKTAGSDPEAMGRALSPTRYEALRDFVQAAWIRSILSGFETHAVNITSSFTATALHPLYKIVGGYGLGDQTMIREGMRQYSYMVSEAATVLGYAKESFKKGRPQLDPNVDRYGQFPADHMDPRRAFGINPDAVKEGGATAGNIAESAVGHAIKLYGDALGVVSTRTLSAQDELFKRAAYHAEALAAAHTDGLSQGLKGAELDAYARKRFEQTFIDDPTLGRIPNPDDPLAQRALAAAKSSTFMNAVPHDSFMGMMKQNIARYPMLKFAVPFPSIIHNLMHYSASLTPGLAHMSKAYQKAMQAGGHEAAVATGKLYMGYALWTLALASAVSGNSRGSGPLKNDGRPDWPARQMLEQRGRHHGGIDIPGTGASLNAKRMDPFGIIINVPAIVAERIDDFDEEHMGQWATVFAMSLADSVLSRHIMQGLSQLIEAATDMSGKKLGQYVGNIGASIAVPNFINQSNNYLGDPMIREANDWFEMALKRLPVASEGLAARRTPWGEPMKKQGGVITSHKDDDALLNEYARLVETGNKGVPEPLPRTKQVPGEKGSLDLVEFKLSNGKRLYDEYGDRSRDPAPGSIPPLRQRLEDFIESDAYQKNLIDGPGDMPGTKLYAIRRIIGQYRNIAWNTILRDHPEVVERVYHKRRTIGQAVEAQRRAVTLEAYGLDDGDGDE